MGGWSYEAAARPCANAQPRRIELLVEIAPLVRQSDNDDVRSTPARRIINAGRLLAQNTTAPTQPQFSEARSPMTLLGRRNFVVASLALTCVSPEPADREDLPHPHGRRNITGPRAVLWRNQRLRCRWRKPRSVTALVRTADPQFPPQLRRNREPLGLVGEGDR